MSQETVIEEEIGERPGMRIAMARLAIGLLQGLALWLLYEAEEAGVWPGTDKALLTGLCLTVVAAPFVLLGGLGALKARLLAVWAAVAAVVLFAVGWYEGWRGLGQPYQDWFQSPAIFAAFAGLFIAHHLVEGGQQDGRRIARYATLFELASKHAVQLAMSAAFTGVFWIVLNLGAELFKIIGLDGFQELIRKDWFAYPATGLAFAAAVHLTDVRGGLIHGVRTVGLTLLGWLLPLLALLVAAFVVALPFTGLQPLWDTRSATAILLGAAATLVVLTVAAYQDGTRPAPRVLQWSMRLAGAVLVPLAALAVYALVLRVGQYGWTAERVLAAAWALVTSLFAAGFAFAAASPGPTMRRLEPTVVAGAWATLAVILLLLSPVGDPVKLSVADQMARLAQGKVTPAKFDYAYLRFEAGRVGREALERLKAGGGEAGRRADHFLRLERRWQDAPAQPVADQLAAATVWPKGQAIPEGLRKAWPETGARVCDTAGQPCEIILLDLNEDGRPEALVSERQSDMVVVSADETGVWRRAGVLSLDRRCGDDPRDALRRGEITLKPSRWRDVEIGGRRFFLRPVQPPCDGEKPEAPPDPAD